MNANYIRPIPKRIEKRILDYDAKRTDYRGLRFYSYLTTIQKETRQDHRCRPKQKQKDAAHKAGRHSRRVFRQMPCQGYGIQLYG